MAGYREEGKVQSLEGRWKPSQSRPRLRTRLDRQNKARFFNTMLILGSICHIMLREKVTGEYTVLVSLKFREIKIQNIVGRF